MQINPFTELNDSKQQIIYVIIVCTTLQLYKTSRHCQFADIC